MFALLGFILAILTTPFKSRSRVEADSGALRHQLIVLGRRAGRRVRLTNGDRLFFVQLYRWFPSILRVITIVSPETLVRWHRAGFRRYWRWKSRLRAGRPPLDRELRALIRRMSLENPLWVPRASTVSCSSWALRSRSRALRSRRRGAPSQGWRTFLRNHAPDIAAMDLFIAPTIGFEPLYAIIIVRLNRRELVWINVTTRPTHGMDRTANNGGIPVG